jgi:hypothetical protein
MDVDTPDDAAANRNRRCAASQRNDKSSIIHTLITTTATNHRWGLPPEVHDIADACTCARRPLTPPTLLLALTSRVGVPTRFDDPREVVRRACCHDTATTCSLRF